MIVIRSEEAADRQAIFEVNRLAFGQDNESRLIEKMRETKHFIPGLSLIALLDDIIVGHILFSVVSLEHPLQFSCLLALAPLAVKPEYQRQGIGSLLVREGIERAARTNYPGVVVLGHPQYYLRFGFTRAVENGIICPYPVPDEAYMLFELRPEAMKGLKGTVKYPDFFSEVKCL